MRSSEELGRKHELVWSKGRSEVATAGAVVSCLVRAGLAAWGHGRATTRAAGVVVYVRLEAE